MTPLKYILRERGIKARWLAKQCGLNEGNFSQIVNGKHVPTLMVALRISEVVGVTVNELWGYLLEDDPVKRAVDNAPIDDEPITEEEENAVREAEKDFKEGHAVSMEDLKRELGFEEDE